MTGIANFLGFTEGDVAIVTGAATGIGRETAIQLLAQKVRVIGLDINAAGLEALGGPALLAR